MMPPNTLEWTDYEKLCISLEEIAQLLRAQGRRDVARLIDGALKILDAKEKELHEDHH